jgi:hypothetical protein
MDVVHQCCCGLDVRKDSVTACVLWREKEWAWSAESRLTFIRFERVVLFSAMPSNQFK